MSASRQPLFLLQEEPDINQVLNEPLKSTQRIKYTCFDVSRHLIAFGATSGGIYVFNSHPCEFLQLIPNKDGAITRIAISPDEKHIGFANGRGVVTVTECDPTLSANHKSVSSKEHQGNEVTALIWRNGNTLFAGDDIGRISVLVLPNFITKTIFQNGSQTIMNLDSRIVQLDVKDCMLLVSTTTRCFICDTSIEQYRQIGQKLRDGAFGACFATKDVYTNGVTGTDTAQVSVVKKYTIVDDEAFSNSEKYANVSIYCARPSFRLWEASIDGTVQRTHQYKHVLSRKPLKVISIESYENGNVSIEKFSEDIEAHSSNFPKIICIKNCAIFSYKKDALYFLDINDVDNTMWFETYKDILDCKIYHDLLYVWREDGTLVKMRYIKIEKFLLKCYLDKKYELCAELCALYEDYLIKSDSLSTKLKPLAGLKDNVNEILINKIEKFLQKIENVKDCAAHTKSGVHVIDNTYNTQITYLSDDDETVANGDHRIPSLKELSHTMTDKLHTSKKILKEKWDDFEDKMKHLTEPRRLNVEIEVPRGYHDEEMTDTLPVYDNDSIVHNEFIDKNSEEETQISTDIEDDQLSEGEKLCRKLYQQWKLIEIDETSDRSAIVNLLEENTCDIFEVYKLMNELTEYCVTVQAIQEANFMPNSIFLSYLTDSSKREDLLSTVVENDTLCKYFVDSCITVNTKTQKISNIGCDCGFPLPFDKTNAKPEYSEIIDEFIEKQWSSIAKEQCYDVCKKMPYLWRKILYLRRNEDLTNLLNLLLQLLDEDILHSFLPQFTIETWEKAVKLFAVLQTNRCLNCNKKFNHSLVKTTLNWDDIGALLIKSIGGKEAINLFEKNAELINQEDLSVKFYHSAILDEMFGKYDATLRSQLVDAVFESYETEEAIFEICKLLRSTLDGDVKNTSLPIAVAAHTSHWGLSSIYHHLLQNRRTGTTLQLLVQYFNSATGNTDCNLCGLPYVNEVLIQDGGLWVFKCGHIFHGACLDLNKVRLCTLCL